MTVLDRPASKLHVLLLVTTICCIHFGASEFYSVQFLAFSASVVLAWRSYPRQCGRLGVAGVVLVGAAAVSYVLAEHSLTVFLKGIRTALVMLLLVAWQRHLSIQSHTYAPLARQAILIACTAALALGVAQLLDSLTVNSGLFDVPESFFALDYGTIFTERRRTLASAGYLIRPVGFFSEPSALAALGVLGVFVSYACRWVSLRIIGFALVVVSQSLSGLVLAGLIAVASASSARKRAVAILASLPVLVIPFMYVGTSFGSRFSSVLDGTDTSAQVRIFEPLRVLARLLGEHKFFGAGPDYLLSVASSSVSTVFDNWIINQFLLYGVLGLVWVLVPFLLLRRTMWPLLFAFMVTNGDTFYYDRYLFLLLAMAAISDVKRNFANDHYRNHHIQ